MALPVSCTPPLPFVICGHLIESALGEGESSGYLASSPGGRDVVLKPLDPDCVLHKGNLHPSVRDRLARVRGLAMAGVANLYGIERNAEQPGRAWLIWEYIPGQTLADYVSAAMRTPRELALIFRELILRVEALHAQGIVHGAIHGGNVIVTPTGGLRLTHISPLLYTDPAEDARCIAEVLSSTVCGRDGTFEPLCRLSIDASDETWEDVPTSLRRLSARLGTLATPGASRKPTGITIDQQEGRAPRRLALAGAIIVILLGLATAYGIWHAVAPTAMPAAHPPLDPLNARFDP